MAYIPGYFEKGNSLSQKNFLLIESPPPLLIYTDCIIAGNLNLGDSWARSFKTNAHDSNEGAGVIIQNSLLDSSVYTRQNGRRI